MPPSMPFVESGKLRALAVTSNKRSLTAPDVPTMIEAGVPDFVATNWFAYFVPAGTPNAIVGTLNAEINRSLSREDIKAKLVAQGLDPLGTTPEDLGKFLREENAKFAKLVKLSGLKSMD